MSEALLSRLEAAIARLEALAATNPAVAAAAAPLIKSAVAPAASTAPASGSRAAWIELYNGPIAAASANLKTLNEVKDFAGFFDLAFSKLDHILRVRPYVLLS